MKKYLTFLLFFFSVFLLKAQDSASVSKPKCKCRVYNGGKEVYCKPRLFSFFTNLPQDYSAFYKREFRKEQIKKYVAIVIGSAILYVADEDILLDTQRFGNSINVSGNDHSKALFELAVKTKSKVIALPFLIPTDANSAMYYVGDGATHFSISFGFWAYGKITRDYRAEKTGEQIIEAIFASGVATQFLKHITGRESPFTTKVPRGVWRFFPNQKDYSDHVPHYDAFPTGHLATAVGTVTVIADNYPEWRMVKPIGYTLCGLLGFAMVNNGVHWASDYPLGIALGYSFAKCVTARDREESNQTDRSTLSRNEKHLHTPLILPAFLGNGGFGASAHWVF